ncbi:glycosyltransferase [bacterium]|nr:glycosyltransferase [bacterium]
MLTTIIKTHNCENTLYDVLESVKKSDEIIIVDAHSSDDTVKIAKEYKANVVYAYVSELSQILNQTLDEVQNDWILFLNDNEMVSNELLDNIFRYIQKPKRNKNAMSLPIKKYYLEKEITSARIKSSIRVFNKQFCSFKQDNTGEIELNKSKIHKFNRGFSPNKGFIISTRKKTFPYFQEMIEKNLIEFREYENDLSIFSKPFSKFLYWYLWRGAIFDGKRGFIYSFGEAVSSFMIGCAEYERIEDDIQQD